MDRKEFLGAACCMGICSCLGGITGAFAEEQPSGKPNSKEIEALKWQIGDVQQKYASAIATMFKNVDEKTRDKILEEMGTNCAKSYQKMFDKYKNNLPGFLEQAKREWVEKAEYDEKNKVITIVDRATTCNCPAVQKTAVPGAYCQCSLGWQKYAYSTIVGKPVDVVVVESILRGGKRCAFKITILG